MEFFCREGCCSFLEPGLGLKGNRGIRLMGLRLHPKMIRKMGFSTWAVRIARSWWLAVKANCKTAVCYVVGGRVVSCDKFDMMVVESPSIILLQYTPTVPTQRKKEKEKRGAATMVLTSQSGWHPLSEPTYPPPPTFPFIPDPSRTFSIEALSRHGFLKSLSGVTQRPRDTLADLGLPTRLHGKVW